MKQIGKTKIDLNLIVDNEFVREQIEEAKTDHAYEVEEIIEIGKYQDDFFSFTTLRSDKNSNAKAGTILLTTYFHQ
ncbi:MAG: hypothetical protein WC119_00515 [Synergistaceae bacterium]